MATYEGWKVGDYAIRKNRLCRILEIHFDEYPPHVSVQMLDDNNEIGTEFEKIRRPTEEEMASLETAGSSNENPNVNIENNTVNPTDVDVNTVNPTDVDVNTVNPTDIDVNIGENNNKENDDNDNDDKNIINDGSTTMGESNNNNDNNNEIKSIPINSHVDDTDSNSSINRKNKVPSKHSPTSRPQLKRKRNKRNNNNSNNDTTHNNKNNNNRNRYRSVFDDNTWDDWLSLF